MREQRTFPYFDGSSIVHGDPLRIQRELYAALGDPDACLADAYPELAPGQEMSAQQCLKQAGALGCLYANAREVLKMQPFDAATGQGATEEDVETALDAFWSYLEAKKKRAAGSPTSSPPTTSTPTASTTTPS